MKARTIAVDLPVAAMDQAVRFTREVLVPAARAQEGYRGYIALYDPATGRSLAVTLWEDERTESASDEAARAGRNQAAAALGATITGVDRYEVVVAELA